MIFLGEETTENKSKRLPIVSVCFDARSSEIAIRANLPQSAFPSPSGPGGPGKLIR